MIALVNPVSTGVELARAFRERGVACVHVYSPDARNRPHFPGVPHIECQDVSQTEDELRELAVTSVVPASEYGVLLADELAHRLGLSENVHELSSARRDKLLMTEQLESRGLRAARTATVRSESELGEVLADATYPVFIKPRNSAGGDGCRICVDAGEVRAAFADVIGQRNFMGLRNEVVLVQEYLDGPQFIVNTVSAGGEHVLTEFYECRIDRQPDGAAVYRHILSARALDDTAACITRYVFDCLDALGIVQGAGHTEVRLVSDGPCLVEVNARIMGPSLAPDPYFAAFGYSHQHLLVESTLDPADFVERRRVPYRADRHLAKVFLRAHAPGVVRAVPGLDVLRRLPAFHSVPRLAEVGEPVPERLLATGASGVAYFVHEDRATIEDALKVLHDLEDAGQFYEVDPLL